MGGDAIARRFKKTELAHFCPTPSHSIELPALHCPKHLPAPCPTDPSFDDDLATSVYAIKGVPLSCPGIRGNAILVWVNDQPWIVSDLHKGNIIVNGVSLTRFLEEGLRLRLERKPATPAAHHLFRVFEATTPASSDWDTIRRIADKDQ